MQAPQILIVENESDIRAFVAGCLRVLDCHVQEADSARAALTLVKRNAPHIVLVSSRLPDASGLELVRLLKVSDEQPPGIVLMTSHLCRTEHAAALRSGVDRVVRKPFPPQHLIENVEGLLRLHAPAVTQVVVEYAGLSLNVVTAVAYFREFCVSLGPTEARLLGFFITHPERAFSRSQILGRVWSSTVRVDERAVDAHVRWLRRALRELSCAELLQTVRGTGYRLSSRAL